ncbi:MAG: 5-(carboxyamino)imidazole ribonucleotide synthase [Dehalococcoidia bacterium]
MPGGVETLPPGARIGIIGGGQLGRMLALAARQMGYRIIVLDPDPDSPAAQVADDMIVAKYSSRDAARELARKSDVLTYEFENVDAEAVEAAAEITPLHPSDGVLRKAQHRVREKEALTAGGFPVAKFWPVETESEFTRAISDLGVPVVLKTATMGYDGKGQAVIRSEDEAEQAFQALGGGRSQLVLERFVPFKMEVSVICARDGSGHAVTFPCSENVHVDGILDVSIVPARVSPGVAEAASRLAAGIAEALNVVGLIAVEMFVTQDDALLVNELAPRPHNSGHYTMDACRTSQFEQLARILCGLPMGAVDMPRPAVMVNLLGDAWEDAGGQPDFASALAVPGVSLHLYGKAEARKGRKMGHITAVADDVETALANATAARDRARRR